MCNYSYKDLENAIDLNCQIKEKLGKKGNQLPMDSKGFCIFHSEDVNWKKEQGFVIWLSKLNSCYKSDELRDFKGIQFVADKDRNQIDYIKLLVNSELNQSVFHQIFLVENTIIEGDLTFKQCTLPNAIHISHSDFLGTVTFTDIKILDDTDIPIFIFHNCNIKQSFYFVNNLDCEVNFSMKKCEFEAIEFKEFRTSEKELGTFDFIDCHVKNADFSDCTIYYGDFSKSHFHSAEFKNVILRDEIVFNSIKVERNLKFIGTSERHLFEGTTNFSIDFEEIKGEIYFEFVNLSSLLKSHKDRLLDYEKVGDGKIKIGSGCIKYRRMSPDMTYKMEKSNQFLISEIGTSFATYFTVHNGFNLGIEVRNKKRDEITLFYFTDEDISEESFVQMLGITSERIFGINQDDTDLVSIQDEATINFKLDMARSLAKASYQNFKNNWSKEDSLAFFSTLMPAPVIQLDKEAAHAFLENVAFKSMLEQTNKVLFQMIQIGNKNLFIDQVNANNFEIKDKEL